MRWAVLGIVLVVGCGGAEKPAPPPAPIGNVAPRPEPAHEMAPGDPTGPIQPVSGDAVAAAPAWALNPPPLGCGVATSRAEYLDLNGDGKVDVRRFYQLDAAGAEYVQCKLTDLDFDGRWDIADLFVPGQVVTEMFDLDFDGKVDTVRRYRSGTGAPIP